jgi:vesicle coat complex subunit
MYFAVVADPIGVVPCHEQDPSVMSAALCALHEVVARDPKPYKNLIPSFISILKQASWKGLMQVQEAILERMNLVLLRKP